MSVVYALADTSVLIDLERLDFGAYADAVLVTSAVCIGELASGLDTGADPEVRHARLRDVLHGLEVMPYGVEEAKLYGALCALVRAAGRNPRPRHLDLQIGATAAASRLPLLTCNPSDFLGVGSLIDVIPVGRAG
jgi:predicted nucleic acid-binding protein